jgi:CRP-like cAMP-binding protein
MSRPNNESYSSFCFYTYLQEHVKDQKPCEVTENFIDKNNYIYRPQNNEGFIYEIVSGAVKLGSYSEQGDNFAYDILQKGDFFGNLRYLNGQFYEFSKTLIDTKIRIYEISFFKKTVIHNPYLSDWFISYLVKRWCISEKKLGNITGNTIEGRITFLMKLFDVPVKDANGHEYILFDLLTQKDLGDLSGVTRQTISNILKKKSVCTF